MPDVEISIGERKFFVTCREGEEAFLIAAAKMLDAEAQPIQAQLGRLPESRMLLMAGLMLADRMASLEEELAEAKAGQGQAGSSPIAEDLEELAMRAEVMAARLEEHLG
jgi:cell division protein ZapA